MDTVPRAGTSKSCNLEGVFCGPRGLPYGRHSLYHNNGDGTFTDVPPPSGIGKAEGGYGLTVVAADFDNDGWPDIYVACDSTPSLLFRNNHDGTFTEQGIESGVALSDDGMVQAGMGARQSAISVSTATCDIFKTHFANDTPAVYINNGKGEFRDGTLRSGPRGRDAIRHLGHRRRGPGQRRQSRHLLRDRRHLSRSAGELRHAAHRVPQPGEGKFEELIERGRTRRAGAHSSRGCAFGDFDNDGDVDILIINHNEPPSLLRNDVTGGQSLDQGEADRRRIEP